MTLRHADRARTRILLTCLLLTFITGLSRSAPSRSILDDQALVRAHQVQEESRLESPPSTGGGEDATASVTVRIRQEKRARTKDLGATVVNIGGFLDRLPSDVIRQGRELARHPDRLKQALAEQASLPLLLAAVPHTTPDVLEAKRSWEATLRQYDQATFLEDLIAQYRAFVRELDPGVGPGGHRERAGKIFYFPSALALRGELVRWAVEKQRLVYLQALRHGLSLVAHDYQAAWYSARSAALLEESRALFRDVEAITRTQLQVGKVSQADSLKTQAAIAVLETRLVAMTQEGVAARARINSWLGLPPDTPWGPLQEPTFDPELAGLSVLWKRAQERRQELGQARAAMETASTMLRLGETNLTPRGASGSAVISLGMGAEAGPGRDVRATFPASPQAGTGSAAYGTEAAWVDELRLRAREAEAAHEAEKGRTLRGITDTLAELRASAVLRDTYRATVVPKARLSVEALRSRYIGGQTPFIEFLDAARIALDSSMEEVKATRENWNNMVDLMEWTGGTIAEVLRSGSQAPDEDPTTLAR